MVNSIEGAGLQNVRHDYDIPVTNGGAQFMGDPTGPCRLLHSAATAPPAPGTPPRLPLVRRVAAPAPAARPTRGGRTGSSRLRSSHSRIRRMIPCLPLSRCDLA